MSNPPLNHSAQYPLKLTWFECSKIVDPGVVAVGTLPGIKFKETWRNVELDIKVLTENGITDVFCLCKQSELTFFRVRELLDAYHAKHIRVHHYPIEPALSPTYKDIKNILSDLWNSILDGRKVYIHARGLLGRVSVLLAAFYMELEEQVTPAHAIFKIRELIGNGAFQTMQQYNFVDGFRDYQAQHLHEFLQ